MRAVLKYLLLPAFLINCSLFFGQTEILTAGYENGTNFNILYRTERMGKLYGTPRGYGIVYRYSKHNTALKSHYYEIDVQNLRHPKEKKVVGAADWRKRYVYGKLNSVLELRGAYGQQHVLFRKADSKAVEVRYAYSIGPVLAFKKPYYLIVYHGSGSSDGSLVKFDSEAFDPSSSVVGRAAFSNGLDELRITPGATARFSLSFEYAPYTNLVRAIETGIGIDYFPGKIDILANNPAEQFIITFNVGFVFGRKWF